MHLLGVTWQQAGVVVLSSIGIYLGFVAFVRIAGQRSIASMTSFDFGFVVALGAVIGRVVLNRTPTLVAGLVGLATLFVLEAALGIARRSPFVHRLMSRPPMLLLANGKFLEDAMRSSHVVHDEIRARLRFVGVRSLDEVAAVVLERNGSMSVIRAGDPIDDDMLADVVQPGQRHGSRA